MWRAITAGRVSTARLSRISGAIGRDGCGQSGDADQVVRRRNEIASQAGPRQAAEARASEATDRLHPAEDLFHTLANTLADGIADMSRGSPNNRRAAPA